MDACQGAAQLQISDVVNAQSAMLLLQVRALRTNASTQELLKVAVEGCGYQLRKDSPYFDVLT
jgi:hypothetical protein